MQFNIKEVSATLLDVHNATLGDTVYDERNGAVYMLIQLEGTLWGGREWLDLRHGRIVPGTRGRRFPKVSATLHVTREK